jgi:hypothetical protein
MRLPFSRQHLDCAMADAQRRPVTPAGTPEAPGRSMRLLFEQAAAATHGRRRVPYVPGAT